MSRYAPDCLNSTIAPKQEEKPVIVQDARHAIITKLLQAPHLEERLLDGLERGSYDSFQGWDFLSLSLTKWASEPIEFPIHN